LGAIGACALGETPIAPGDTDGIVVLSVLNAGASRQAIWVERLIRPDEPFYGLPRGSLALDPAPSRVEVSAAGGAVHAFARDSATPARYSADFIPVAGRRYDLLVEVAGRHITGTTTVPLPVSILEPAGDTIDVPPTTQRVMWSREPTRHYAWLVTTGDSGAPYFLSPTLIWVGTDSVVDVPSFAFPPTGGSTLWVLAADSVTAALYDYERTARRNGFAGGNLIGAVGVFGAFAWDQVAVRPAMAAP
jgi:hypothetical protein